MLVLKLSLLSITKLLAVAEFDQLKSYYVSLWEIFPFVAFIGFFLDLLPTRQTSLKGCILKGRNEMSRKSSITITDLQGIFRLLHMMEGQE